MEKREDRLAYVLLQCELLVSRASNPKRQRRIPMESETPDIQQLLVEIRDCRNCEEDLPCGPRPIVAAHQNSRILIIGQAPGVRVHTSGVPWDDPSGQRLREWMGIDSLVNDDRTRLDVKYSSDPSMLRTRLPPFIIK